jgi:hypothetical protein
MPIVRGDWAELLAPGLNRATFLRTREFPTEFTAYNDVQNSTRAYEDDYEMDATLGPLVKKGELTPTTLDEPFKLGGTRYVHDTFALGFLVSQEMRDDEQYGLIQRLAAALGRSSRITQELYGHDVLNNAFSASKYVGRDGKALIATDHPVVGTGLTYSNGQTVATDLSEAALEAAIGAFDNMVDERGLPAEIRPRYLLISPENRFLAARLLNSTLMPGTPNNDINVLAGEGITPIIAHWLTDKDAWFLLAAGEESPMKFWFRERPNTKTWDDNNADGTFHKIRQRHSVGFTSWRGIWGSPGA